jgi:hypothetical protein
MCTDTFFVGSALGPIGNEKWCVDLSHFGHTRAHYVTRRSHWMQKHKFGVTCPGTFFWDPQRAHPSMKNSVSMFCVTDAPEWIT